MTISTSVNIAVGRGDGANKVFTFNFLVPDASYLVITYTDASGVQTVIPAGQFTPAGIGNPAGGTITYPLAGPAIPAGASLTIQRLLPYQQSTSLVNQGAYSPAAVEGALDNLEMQIQQLAGSIATSGYRPPPQDINPTTVLPVAAARAGKFFGFDGNGNPSMLNGNLLAGDLLPYTVGGAAWSNPNYATKNQINFNAAWAIVFSTALAAGIYGLTTQITRTGGAGSTTGAQFDALSATGVSTPATGAVGEAWAQPGSTSPVTGLIASTVNETNNNTSAKYGLQAYFTDRAFGVATVQQGLGANEYNLGAAGVWISANTRSTAGEFCGWRRGVLFDPDSLDADVNGGAIGIDFAKVRYYGGTNPLTAYRMTAAIRFAPFQSILWNGDPSLANDPTEPAANAVRTFFDSAANRIIFSTAAVEMFSISTTTGDIYRQGVLVTPVSLAANNVWTGTNTFNNTVTLGADLTFSGARKITGDFSNATIANRVLIQSSVVNGSSDIVAIPNGASPNASFNVFNTTATANGAYGRIAIGNAVFSIQSTQIGAAAALPMTFYAGVAAGAEQMRLSLAGQLLINTSVDSPVAGAKLRVNGIVQIDNAVAFNVYLSAPQIVGTGAFSLITFDTKRFDQNNNFNTGTHRFTPPAGKYFFSAMIGWAGTVDQKRFATYLYKNGTQVAAFNNLASGTDPQSSCLAYVDDANGTDYFEIYSYQTSGGGATISNNSWDTYFCGFRIG